MPAVSDKPPALLRSPPFLGAGAAVSLPDRTASLRFAEGTADLLLAAIREARVGGRFWARPMRPAAPTILVRIRSAAEIAPLRAMLADAERAPITWMPPPGAAGRAIAKAVAERDAVVARNVDPWSLLEGAVRLFAHGDDEWVTLAHIAGRPVDILSYGRFGAPGADLEQLRRCASDSLTQVRYRDPFTGQDTDVQSVIAQLGDWRRTFESNRTIVAACGIAWWKRHEIARFLRTPERAPRFLRSEKRAIAYAARRGGAIAVWPSRISAGMADAARAKAVTLIRIEDGFVRSVGLGSNLVPPSSITVDRLGIHYDPSCPSDLEVLLATAQFPPALLARARRLLDAVVRAGISKYGGGDDHAFPGRQPGRRIVLVPGQVEDDMSVRLGGGGLSSNLELLRRTRSIERDAEIWFRPHPDVDAGHRRGAVRDEDALHLADRVVRGGGMAQLLDHVDGVHVLTSLTGFEAVLRGREVFCHGTPFYAGWGLTRDLAPVSGRRGRQLTLEQLVAAVLILYPRYLDPVTQFPCPPEVLIHRITHGVARNRLSWVSYIRKLQGRFMRQAS